MAKTTGVFDWEEGSGGISIVPARNYITNAAESEAELRAQINAARADLDAVERRAAVAIRERQSRPLFLEVAPDADRS